MHVDFIQRTTVCVTIAVVIAMLCTGCSHGSKSSPTASTSSITGSNLNSSGNGRSILSGKCAACHTAPQVSSYSQSQWTNSIIPSMAPKAGLSSSDTQTLTDYVISVLNNRS